MSRDFDLSVRRVSLYGNRRSDRRMLGITFFSIVTMLTFAEAGATLYPTINGGGGGRFNIASFNLGTALGGALGSIPRNGID